MVKYVQQQILWVLCPWYKYIGCMGTTTVKHTYYSPSSLSPPIMVFTVVPREPIHKHNTSSNRRQWEAREAGATLQLVQAGRWWKENKFQFKDFNQAFGLTCVTLKIEWSGSKCKTTWTSLSVYIHVNANQDVTLAKFIEEAAKWLSQFVNCLYFLLHD